MKYDYIVLGAGVAGLAFGYQVAKKGKTVLLLEKEKKVGGLSRTLVHKGFRLDFCGHRFHTQNKELLKTLRKLIGPSFKRHIKKSRIFMFNKYLKYPFELPNLLRAMRPLKSVYVVSSYLANLILKKARKKEFDSYQDWFVYYFGPALYEIMGKPYASKIWKTDPVNFSADWAEQRFEGVKIKELITKTIKKLVALDFSSYSLEDEQLAPDAGEFYYGQTGAQEIPNAFQKKIVEYGSKIVTGVKLIRVSEKGLKVYYQMKKRQG